VAGSRSKKGSGFLWGAFDRTATVPQLILRF
jgi:hypothetical protein